MHRSTRSERAELAEALRQEGHAWSSIADALRVRWPELSPRAALRVARGWSQKDAASAWSLLWPENAKEGKDFSLWENWPQAGRAPSLDVLIRLARLYEVSIADLVSDVADYRHLDRFATADGHPSPSIDQIRGFRSIYDIGIADHPKAAFFGPGPVTVAIPLRGVPDRRLPVITYEDALASQRLRRLLDGMMVESGELHIPPHGVWEPPVGDVVAICGPKTSPIIAQALTADPFLAFEPDGDRWVIRRRDVPAQIFRSPIDASDPTVDPSADVAYVGRVTVHDRTALVIAGIHALGSVGAVDYLARNLADLHEQVGKRRFSMVIHSDHAGASVLDTEVVCGPLIHP